MGPTRFTGFQRDATDRTSISTSTNTPSSSCRRARGSPAVRRRAGRKSMVGDVGRKSILGDVWHVLHSDPISASAVLSRCTLLGGVAKSPARSQGSGTVRHSQFLGGYIYSDTIYSALPHPPPPLAPSPLMPSSPPLSSPPTASLPTLRRARLVFVGVVQ